MHADSSTPSQVTPYSVVVSRPEGAIIDGPILLILGLVLLVGSGEVYRLGSGVELFVALAFFIAALFAFRFALRLLYTELTLTNQFLMSRDRLGKQTQLIPLDQVAAYAIETPTKGFVHRIWLRDKNGKTYRLFYSPKAFHAHVMREMDARGIRAGRR